MTTDQYIIHFTLWAMAKSPLILGNDLTIMVRPVQQAAERSMFSLGQSKLTHHLHSLLAGRCLQGDPDQ